MWRVYKEARQPIPRLADDDVVNFIVLEAMALKVGKEDHEALDEQKRKEWKRDTGELRKSVGT